MRDLVRRASVALLLTCLFAPAPAPARQRAGSPAAVVSAYARFHLQRKDLAYMCRECVEREKAWFTPELYRLLVAEMDRYDKAAAENGGPDNYKPFVAGDVFSGREDTARSFRVGRVKQAAGRATVQVTWFFGEEPKNPVWIVLVRRGREWLIDDVIYSARDTLVDMLNRPEYDSYGT